MNIFSKSFNIFLKSVHHTLDKLSACVYKCSSCSLFFYRSLKSSHYNENCSSCTHKSQCPSRTFLNTVCSKNIDLAFQQKHVDCVLKMFVTYIKN